MEQFLAPTPTKEWMKAQKEICAKLDLTEKEWIWLTDYFTIKLGYAPKEKIAREIFKEIENNLHHSGTMRTIHYSIGVRSWTGLKKRYLKSEGKGK